MSRLLSLVLLCLSLVAPPSHAKGSRTAVLSVTGMITDESVEATQAALADALVSGAESIVFIIDSGGGNVEAGERLARDIERTQVPVTCIVDGEAASMAFYLLQSCPTRLATLRSKLMVHEPFMVVQAIVHLKDVEAMLADMRKMVDEVGRHCSSRMNITYDEYSTRVLAAEKETWWMTPAEALAVHALDRVVDSVKVALPVARAVPAT